MALESGYDGDEALTALLSAAGGETNINSVRALIDGVNARNTPTGRQTANTARRVAERNGCGRYG